MILSKVNIFVWPRPWISKFTLFTKKFYPRLSWIIRLSCSSRSLRKFNLLSLTTELRMLRVSLRFTLPKIRLKGWGVFASLLNITWFWKTLWWNFIASYALITALVRSTWFELITLFTYSPINFFCNGLIATNSQFQYLHICAIIQLCSTENYLNLQNF